MSPIVLTLLIMIFLYGFLASFSVYITVGVMYWLFIDKIQTTNPYMQTFLDSEWYIRIIPLAVLFLLIYLFSQYKVLGLLMYISSAAFWATFAVIILTENESTLFQRIATFVGVLVVTAIVTVILQIKASLDFGEKKDSYFTLVLASFFGGLISFFLVVGISAIMLYGETLFTTTTFVVTTPIGALISLVLMLFLRKKSII